MNEHDRALMEGELVAASDAYFGARPLYDMPRSRGIFEAGFKLAWKPPVTEKPAQPEDRATNGMAGGESQNKAEAASSGAEAYEPSSSATLPNTLDTSHSTKQPESAEPVAVAWCKARNAWMKASRHGTQLDGDEAAIAVLMSRLKPASADDGTVRVSLAELEDAFRQADAGSCLGLAADLQHMIEAAKGAK